MSISDSESRLDVASSRIRMRGSASMARAIETRWRCPPLNFTPRSPIIVSYPSGKRSANSSTRARPRERHVFADRAVKQERLLQHDAQARAVRIEAHGCQVHTVHQHAALK